MFGIDKDKIKKAFAQFEKDLAAIKASGIQPSPHQPLLPGQADTPFGALQNRVDNIEKFINSLKAAFL
jgi:hypothetical protein